MNENCGYIFRYFEKNVGNNKNGGGNGKLESYCSNTIKYFYASELFYSH
jgi:hypothetical protein